MKAMIYKLGYYLKRPMVLNYYNEFLFNESQSIAELEITQLKSLKLLIEFCFDHIPYYQKLFKSIGMLKNDFKSMEDLERLPILTKAQIKSDPKSFRPTNIRMKYINSSTGGSTGTPLKYRMSKQCYERGLALQLKGWGMAGYKLGDKMAIIAGASLVSNQKTLKNKVQNYILNNRRYSSYGMDSGILNRYALEINQWKPVYLSGYASSLYLLAKHISENNIDMMFSMNGILSTAEVLSVKQKELIERVFRAKVFDNYGLNDGGVSAYECGTHDGRHIDYERSILQTVDETGKVVVNKMGRIIATSLYNFAMPFIRYDTGDLGLVDTRGCECGSKRALLRSVYGRVTDYLKLNDRVIGSPVLTVLMGKVDFENYQIIQKNFDEIDIKYVKDSYVSDLDESFIKKSFSEHVGNIKINFKKVKLVEFMVENKHKFIVNEVCK